MDSIGGIIWVAVAIIFTIMRAANKKAKQQQHQQGSNTTTVKSNPLQSQLNNALKQINDIKTSAAVQTKQNVPKIQSRTQQNQRPAYRSSLEGYQMEGHQVEGYQMEGAQVEGYQVEGHQVEGIARKHSDSKFRKDKIAVTESSMNGGYAGEGCEEHYDFELAYTGVSQKTPKEMLYFSSNPVVQGVVMSQILERPKRR